MKKETCGTQLKGMNPPQFIHMWILKLLWIEYQVPQFWPVNTDLKYEFSCGRLLFRRLQYKLDLLIKKRWVMNNLGGTLRKSPGNGKFWEMSRERRRRRRRKFREINNYY